MPIEIEPTEEAIVCRQFGSEMAVPWATFIEIEERPDSIGFFSTDGTAVVVNDSGFESPGHRRQFTELARGYYEAARGGEGIDRERPREWLIDSSATRRRALCA